MNNEIEILEEIKIATKIKFQGKIWIPEQKYPMVESVGKIVGNLTHPTKHYVKQNYLIKWLKINKKAGDVFTLEDFFRVYPKHEKDVACRKRINKVISSMIKEHSIVQIGENRFRMLR